MVCATPAGKEYACGNKACWSATTIVFFIISIAGLGLILSLEGNCCDWTDESDHYVEGMDIKSCRTVDRECSEEAASGGASCQSKESEGCTLEGSANDEAQIDVPTCAQACNFGVSFDSFAGRETHCKWLETFPANWENEACVASCYDTTELQSQMNDCASSEQYPNGCCEEDCSQPAACSKSHDDRAAQFMTGAALVVLGVILGAIFSCGICPMCCYVRNIPGPTAAPVGATVVQAQAVIQAQAVEVSLDNSTV